MNICWPDSRNSCAACCGLYNIDNAVKSFLEDKLLKRTALFKNTERSCSALIDFKDHVSKSEEFVRLDPVIHVCVFVGFVDDENKILGCLLHPTTRGNAGIDLRGLCHYGSMACKMFYCPSWLNLPEPMVSAVCEAVSDWHLYGLVITDGEFLCSIFRFLEESLGVPLNKDILLSGRQGELFKEILSWKDSWPFKGDSLLRRNRYHFKFDVQTRDDPVQGILSALEYTFGIDRTSGTEEFVSGKLMDVILHYKHYYYSNIS